MDQADRKTPVYRHLIGAVREVIESVMKAQGKREAARARYVNG
jgi:hypothetical protein